LFGTRGDGADFGHASKCAAPKAAHLSEKLVSYITRFPDKMRNKIAALAKANGQSMNAELKEVPLLPGGVIYE
jgi:Arc-like DNA binding domain